MVRTELLNKICNVVEKVSKFYELTTTISSVKYSIQSIKDIKEKEYAGVLNHRCIIFN
jgi:hypothetical protein